MSFFRRSVRYGYGPGAGRDIYPERFKLHGVGKTFGRVYKTRPAEAGHSRILV